MKKMAEPANNDTAKNDNDSNNKVKSRVKVSIFGQEYVVRGNCPTEQIHQIADYVHKIMEETRRRSPNLSVNKLAVLASLNLAEELFRIKNEYEGLLETLEEEQRR